MLSKNVIIFSIKVFLRLAMLRGLICNMNLVML